jgi:outer membrane protein
VNAFLFLLALAQAIGGQVDTPKAPPPRVKDMSAPPAIGLPGPDAAPPIGLDQPLSADEAAKIALHLQPTLAAARGNVASAQGRTNQIRSNLLPQVAVGAGYDNLQSASGYGALPTQSPTGFLLPTVSPVDTLSGALQVKQLLYDFNQTRNLVRQSKANERVAINDLNQAQSTLVYNVKNDYYLFAYAERLVDVNQQNLANRQRQLDLAVSRMDNGIGLPSDVVTAETSKSQAILQLNVARDTSEQAEVALLAEMGVDPLTPIVVNPTEERLYNVDSPKPLLRTALKRRPEIKAAEQAVLASRFGLSASKAVDLPSLYAGVAAGTRGEDFPLDDSTLSLQLGIQIPLYDGGLRSGSIQFSKGQVTVAESQLQSAILTVRQDVAGAFLALKSAEQRVTIANNEADNAGEGVRIAEGRYRSGLGLFLDITTAQGLLLGALTDQDQAEQALMLARTRVRYATGENLDLVR